MELSKKVIFTAMNRQDRQDYSAARLQDLDSNSGALHPGRTWRQLGVLAVYPRLLGITLADVGTYATAAALLYGAMQPLLSIPLRD